MRLRTLVALASLAALPGGSASAAEAGSGGRTLTVAAAANLKGAAEAIGQAFQAEHPEVEVKLSIGASGNFFAQIQNGAPFDLFLSADTEYPDKLVAAGLAKAEDERVYAFGKLVAWLPPGSTLDLEKRGLGALGESGVKRIAIANPAVAPFGRATVEALKAAGVHDSVKDKLVLGMSVAQAAQFATTGAADVAFLPYSLTFGKELAAGKVFFVPEKLYTRIEQSGVVLAGSKQPALARQLLAFITGEKGRAILTKFGYGLP